MPLAPGALSRRTLSIVIGATLAAAQMARAADGSATDTSTPKQPVSALEEIVVQAQRATSEVARAAQFEAPNLINLTTAAEMARLPDVNTGEAVRRIPGISLETDTGEGRYINIRGLDADLNSTTFGGLRLPPTNNSSPSGAGRAVAFDSIPIGFVGAITVTKSNLPEQDAEALGGTIDITPKTAPSDGRPFAELKLGTGEELLRHTSILDVAGTAGTRFGGHGGYDPFSILVTASVYTDRRGIDDAEAGFTDSQSTGVPDKAMAGFEQRLYTYHRERHGYGADLGYAPDDDNKYFVRYYDAGYSESVYRNRLIWNLSGNGTVDPANPNGLLDTATFTKTLRDEKEYLDTRVFEIGGKNLFNGNTLDYHVGYTKGTYYKPYDYNSSFDNPTAVNVAYDNTMLPNWPSFRVLPSGGSTFNYADPTGYTLTGLRTQTVHSDDHEWGIGANLAIPTRFTDRANEEFKFGVNARLRNKTADQESQYALNGQSFPALPLTSALNGPGRAFYQNHYQNGPNIDASVLRNLWAQNAAIEGTDPVDHAAANVADKEDVYAGYGQYQFGWGKLGLIGGLRIEHTQATYSGNAVYANAPSNQTCPLIKDPTGNTGDSYVCPVSTDRSYTNYFPSLQARYELQPDLIARAAFSSTIARPGFQQITAQTSYDGNGNVTTGNPNLRPTTAYGLDLSIEKYLPHGGILSAGLFDKEIKDYIVQKVRQIEGVQNTGGNLGLVRQTSFDNADKARVYGFEMNVVEHLRDFVAGPLGGLGASLNWTWVDSYYTIPAQQPSANTTIPARNSILPSTSRNTANAELLYDYGPVNLTLGAYYTSRNIFGLGQTAALDVWTQDRFSVDFGSQYKVTDALSAYFNVKNLTNTPLKFTEGEGEDRVIQREFYGITLQVGGTYKF